jgi:hypothetical protein
VRCDVPLLEGVLELVVPQGSVQRVGELDAVGIVGQFGDVALAGGGRSEADWDADGVRRPGPSCRVPRLWARAR